MEPVRKYNVAVLGYRPVTAREAEGVMGVGGTDPVRQAAYTAIVPAPVTSSRRNEGKEGRAASSSVSTCLRVREDYLVPTCQCTS